MDMDMQQIHGHAAWIWTRSMNWNMQHGHRHAAYCRYGRAAWSLVSG
jgi:hypothetical protein